MFDIFNMLKKDENTAAPKQVTRETIIGDILDMDQTTAPYFIEVHGVDCDELLEKLNAHLASKKA